MDAGDYWDSTMTNHLKGELRMSQTIIYITIFFLKEKGKLEGISVIYVNGGIHAETKTFMSMCDKNQARFKSKIVI